MGAVLRQPFPPKTLFTVDALVDSSSLSEDDRAFLREQGPNRLLVYRRLVRGTLRGAVELSIPRTVARMHAISGLSAERSLFQEAFDAYCAERGTRSHFLRDVAPELLAFCGERYAGDPREGVWKLQARNHLAGTTISPGEQLTLP